MTSTNILIVDDIAPLREIIREMLLGIGFTDFLEASDGSEAVKLARAHSPILIISDYMMSPMNGLESLKILKNDEETKKIPFILVSAVGESDIIDTALKLGAASFIPRPLSFDGVRKHVIDALKESMT